MQLLLIEMDQASSGWLAERLSKLSFVPRLAQSPEQALSDGLTRGITAIVVDIGHDRADANSTVDMLRKAGLCQPLMIVAAHGDWQDKVNCLDAGADEYLVKPVRSEEIAARLRAIIRRCAGNPTDRIVIGDLDLDLKAKCAWRAGECLDLTHNEFRLLRIFLLNPEKTMSHAEIRERLYPGGDRRSANAIEVQIARLRRKVGQNRILTVRGLGYRFVTETRTRSPLLSPRGQCKAMCLAE